METVTNSSGDDGPLEGFPLGLLLRMRPLRLSAAQRLPEVTQQGESGPTEARAWEALPPSILQGTFDGDRVLRDTSALEEQNWPSSGSQGV